MCYLEIQEKIILILHLRAKCGLLLEIKKSHYSLYIFSILKLKFHNSSSPSIINAKVCCAVFNSENQVVATAFFYSFMSLKLSGFPLFYVHLVGSAITQPSISQEGYFINIYDFHWIFDLQILNTYFHFLLQVHNTVCRVFLLNANHEFAIIFQSKDWHCGKLYLYGFNMLQQFKHDTVYEPCCNSFQ